MNDNTNLNTNRYLVVDIEFIDDPELYRRYTQIDPRPAERRWPLRRVIAASVMALRTADGVLEVESFRSFGDGSEDRVLTQLFECINQHPDARIVTWAGTSCDVPILRIAAMAHGMKLPRQLAENRRDRRTGQWDHMDLAVIVKHGAGYHVHLSEVAVRLGIPVKFAGSAMNIPRAVREGKLEQVTPLADADVVTTAMVLAAIMVSTGDLASVQAAQLAIIRAVRNLRADAFYDGYLGRVEERLKAGQTAEIGRWMARVA